MGTEVIDEVVVVLHVTAEGVNTIDEVIREGNFTVVVLCSAVYNTGGGGG